MPQPSRASGLPAPGPRRSLARRLLALNVLLVFLPLGGFLFLEPFEQRLLARQERSMVQQGRLLAAALAARPAEPPAIDPAAAVAILERLDRRSDARLRVLDPDGLVLADSSLLPPAPAARARTPAARRDPRPRRQGLYRLAAWPFEIWGRLAPRPALEAAAWDEFNGAVERLDLPEVRAALGGRYGARTRLSPLPEGGLLLYSALPIRQADLAPGGRRILGAVLVSQSTLGVLEELDEVRVRVLFVSLAALGLAVALSLYLAASISRPLRRLAAQARAVVDARGRLVARWSNPDAGRRDEIGDLSAALEALTRQLESRQRATEAFALDISHQFKNPLASIRAAAELLETEGARGDQSGAAERRRSLRVVAEEVSRLERLLTGVTELVRLDAPGDAPDEGLRTAERDGEGIDLANLTRQLVAARSGRIGAAGGGDGGGDGGGGEAASGVALAVVGEGHERPLRVAGGRAEHLAALIENLLDNAVDFSPPAGVVEVELRSEGGHLVLAVRDRGPGIAVENLARVFDRFFSHRPGSPRGHHSGLGLALARAVAESHGGSIEAANRPGGGAEFTVRLPRAGA